MNTIKTLTSYAIYTLLVAVAFTSCTSEKSIESTYTKKNDVSRIKLVETTIINGYRFSIIKVDDKEFFVNVDGGMELLSNCN